LNPSELDSHFKRLVKRRRGLAGRVASSSIDAGWSRAFRWRMVFSNAVRVLGTIGRRPYLEGAALDSC
jgi:hypothetical protein